MGMRVKSVPLQMGRSFQQRAQFLNYKKRKSHFLSNFNEQNLFGTNPNERKIELLFLKEKALWKNIYQLIIA